MKVIIAGSRDYLNYDAVVAAISATAWEITEVVSGKCRGVDALGERWATENGIPVQEFPVTKEDWKRKGLGAGPIRNRAMAEYADGLIALWDGVSKGTKSMIALARAAGLKIHIHRTDVTT